MRYARQLGSTRSQLRVATVAVLALAMATTAACTARGRSAAGDATFSTNAPTGYLPTANWNVFSPSSTVPTAVGPLAFSPLAFPLPTTANNGNTFSPQLAQSWQFKNNYLEFDVHLRPDLKWSDGSPLTSKDVLVSWQLYALNGVWTGLQISDVSAPNATTIRFTRTLPAGRPAYSVGFENALLSQVVAPAKQYETFVPPTGKFEQFKHDLWDAKSAVSGDSAAGKSSTTQLAGYQKKLVSFNPDKKSVLCAGPFKLKNFTPSAVLLDKNDKNWATSKNTIKHVKLYNNTSTTAVNNLLVTGGVDAMAQTPTSPLYRSIMSRNKGTMNYVKPPGYITTIGILFNQKVYPYDLLAVRQAFLYIVDRKGATQASDPVAGAVPSIPAGLPQPTLDYYLTKAQIKSLNPYNHDPDKAVQLLKQAGFSKRGDTWYTPKGKKFEVTIFSATTLESWDLLASNVASQLSDFGIPSKVQLTPVNTYGTQQQKGRFGVFVGYPDGNAYPPYANFTNIFQTLGGWSFDAAGKQMRNPSGPGYSFPESSNVPGVGTVNPAALAYELSATVDQTKVRALAYKAVKWMNYYAQPAVLVYQYQSFFYSTKRFTDWPTKDDPVMRLMGYGSANYFVTVCAELGYLKAK